MQLLGGGDSVNLEQPNSKTRRGRVGKGIANTLTCGCNIGVVVEVNTNKIIREIIPMQVRVRKFEVDIDKLKETLKIHKKESKLTNKQISEMLKQPLTLVEHWFRSDNCFSVPSDDIWFDLKKILKIDTNEFDESITTFEIRDGVYEKSNRVYDSNGIAPTLTVVSAENERYIVREEFMDFVERKLREFISKNGHIPKMFNPYNCQEIKDVSPTCTTQCGSTTSSATVLIMESDKMQQIITVGNYSPSNHNASRIVSTEGLAPTVMENHGTVTAILEEDFMRDKIITINNGKLDSSGATICEQRCDEGLRFFKDNVCGSLRTIDSCGDKRVILENNKLKGGNDMWRNELEKFKFNMDTIRLFDSFAGIGALHQSLKELGVPTEVVGLSEIDIDAIISYAGVHIENFKDLEFEYPSENEMREWLLARNIGYSFEKDKSSIPRLKKDKLYLVYKASVLLNNLGDISKLPYNDIPDFDLFNMSFPCTDISNAGKQQGFEKEDGSVTRSGLYVFGVEVVKAKKPKYIMIENVKGLITKKFIHKFYDMVEEIESLGYKCYYPTKEDKKGNKTPACLNSKDFGIPQNRERIFVICIREDIDNGLFKFSQGFDNGVRLKDTLEGGVDEKYYLSQEIQDRFKLNGNKDSNQNELNIVGSSAPDFRTIGQRDLTYGTNGVMSTLTATDYKQPKQIVDNKKVEHNLRIRKLTPKECWRLMGFQDECFEKAKDLGISDSALYKQAGNSIVTNCLYYIFKELFKQYIINK